MAKRKGDVIQDDGVLFQEKMYRHYLNKYYALFMSSISFPELDYQQEYFLKKTLWTTGSVAIFKKLEEDGIPTVEDYQGVEYKTIDRSDNLFITNYARNGINIYNFPISITPISARGQMFFPHNLENGKDVVIMYASDTHNSILFLIDPILKELVEVEVALRMNRYVQRVPRMVTVTPEDEERAKSFMNKITNGDPVVFLTSDMWQSIQNVIEAGGNYIIDKLYMYKSQLEGEIKTILGVPNNTTEKKERLITSEIESNDIEFALYRRSIIESIKKGCADVEKVLGVKLTVVDNARQEELEDIRNKMLENSSMNNGNGGDSNDTTKVDTDKGNV